LNKETAYDHFLTHGKKEGRSYCEKKNYITKVTIIVHLYHTELFDEFLQYIRNVQDVFQQVTVIFTISMNSNFSNRIQEVDPNFLVIKVENKGTDNYPFLECINYLKSRQIKTDFYLKIHTKISNNLAEDFSEWRKDLIEPITNYSNLCYLQHYFANISNIGYVGSQQCVLPKLYDLDFYQNIQGLEQLILTFPHLEKDWGDFIGGNMFWISHSVLEEFLTPDLIEYIIERVSYGKVPNNLTDKGIYIEYLCERLFTGVFCYNKTNILVNKFVSPFISKRGFYNPKLFTFTCPKLLNIIR
jgi:hypothetical protein